MSKVFEEKKNKRDKKRLYHGTCMKEELYKAVEKLAEKHERSVIREISFLIKEGAKAIGEKLE